MHFCVHLRPRHAHLRRQTHGRLRALCRHADASCPPKQKRHGASNIESLVPMVHAKNSKDLSAGCIGKFCLLRPHKGLNN
jgi:hypothetical protein